MKKFQGQSFVWRARTLLVAMLLLLAASIIISGVPHWHHAAASQQQQQPAAPGALQQREVRLTQQGAQQQQGAQGAQQQAVSKQQQQHQQAGGAQQQEAKPAVAQPGTQQGAQQGGQDPNRPVFVAIMNGHFFSDYEGLTPCTLPDGKPLECRYERTHGEKLKEVDALWWHIPSAGGAAGMKLRPDQLTVGMSMESAAYYTALKREEFMKKFDIEMTYRTCSQVPVYYFDYRSKQQVLDTVFKPEEPFTKKSKALAYVNSNCGSKSPRSKVLKQLMNYVKDRPDSVPVHSYGRCDRNMKVADEFDKKSLIRSHMFCVAMENSLEKDYVTEKIWDALEAGCIPVYLGPLNIREFLPDPNSIIDYRELGTPEKLSAELDRIAANQTLYESMLAWKKRKWDDLSPTFLNWIKTTHVHQPHTRCQLCRLIVNHRKHPETKYTTCLFNKTWMATGQKNEMV